MKIGSRYTFGEVQARHWEQLAEAVGLAKAPARRRILALAKSLPATAHRLQSEPASGFAGNAMVERITALVEHRCALTLRRFSEAAV